MIAIKRENLTNLQIPTSKGYRDLNGSYHAEWLNRKPTKDGYNMQLWTPTERLLVNSIDFDLKEEN